MKRLITFLIAFSFLTISSCQLPAPAHADFNSAYQDQVYNYQLYQQANNQYQIAKSSYLTYRTLTAQDEAIDKFRKVLRARDKVISVYYNLLQEKMNITDGVSADSKKTFNDIKESEKNWLDSHQQKIVAAASLEDLNSVSSEFEQRFKQMDTETKQAIGTIEIAKVSHSKGKIDSLVNQLSSKLSEIGSSGEDTTFANRGLISAKNKLNIYDQKMDSARESFFPSRQSYRNVITLYDGQRRLSEANQYLRETVDYLLEIVKTYTG